MSLPHSTRDANGDEVARVRLLTPQDVPEAHRAVVDGMAAQSALTNLPRAIAHTPVTLGHFYGLLACLWDSSLSPRRREIAILSVVSASDAPYPLGWHLIDAEAAGVTADEIGAIINDRPGAALSPDDAAIVRFARELTIDARVDDTTFQAVASFMNEQQIVELTMTAGFYRLVACVTNALDVDLDDEPARKLAEFRRG